MEVLPFWEKLNNRYTFRIFMAYCIIIRGPAGVGKTTIAQALAKSLDADYFSFDTIMEENNLDTVSRGGISSENFIKANEIIIPLIVQKKKVVLDGCFYRKKQISHLLRKLKTTVYLFTLHANVAECLKRNQTRNNPMNEENIKQVHTLVSQVKIGTMIKTSGKSVQQIVSEIVHHLNR